MQSIIAGRCASASPIGYVLDALGVGSDFDVIDAEGLSSAVIYVPSSDAIVAQTHAAAPLFRAGVEASALRYAADVVLLRVGAARVTADIALAAPPCAAWVENDLTLWSDGASVWLVPESFGPSVAISADGFSVCLMPPYETLDERDAGVARAADRIQPVEA